jgi:hypothetical protein
MAYHLEGRLLEVCTCKAICPCWVGEDPDNGTCDGVLAWHIEKGTIDGVDVGGLTIGGVAHIPGNVLKGNWRMVVLLDERATKEQEQALLAVWTGKKGGPVADLAQLVGEVVSVQRVPVVFDVRGGKGTLRMGKTVAADVEPFVGAHGESTELSHSIFSTIPGSPAYVGRASRYRADAPSIGVSVDLAGHNSVQGTFRFAS